MRAPARSASSIVNTEPEQNDVANGLRTPLTSPGARESTTSMGRRGRAESQEQLEETIRSNRVMLEGVAAMSSMA